MEFMKRLANNLFGRHKTYDAKELGIFHSKVWNCWRNESYYWFAFMKFPIYQEETFVCINGDSNAPSQTQIACLREVLDNWEEIRSQISRIMPKHVRYIKNKEVFIYWKERFYPESVDVFGTDTNRVKITFSTYDLNHSFSFVWRDGYIYDFILGNEEKENIPHPKAYTYYLFDYLYYIGEIWEKSNYRMCGSILLFWYYTFILVIPVYFLLLHMLELSRADDFSLYYIGFNFLFPFLFSWARYKKKRKSALMKHYRYPKKNKGYQCYFLFVSSNCNMLV